MSTSLFAGSLTDDTEAAGPQDPLQSVELVKHDLLWSFRYLINSLLAGRRFTSVEDQLIKVVYLEVGTDLIL